MSFIYDIIFMIFTIYILLRCIAYGIYEIKQENNRLENLIYNLLQRLKDLFKKILHIGTDKEKDNVSEEIKNHYDNNYYNDLDLCYISKGTTKEDELFDYADVPSYFKTNKKSRNERDKDDFEISL